MSRERNPLRRLLPFVLPALLLAAWWAASAAGAFPPILLPGPDAVARRFGRLIASGELFGHAGTSMARVFAGFLISSTAALGLALLLHRRPVLESALSLVLEALRVIPPLSLVPLLILWLGIDEAPKLAIVVLASFFPIYLSSLAALRGVRERYRDLARVFGLSERRAVREILLPGAAPGILTGLRLGFGYAWRALVGAELIAAASGLGYLVEDASSLARTDVVMVGILTIAVLGILCDKLFGRVALAFTPWMRPEARHAPAAAPAAPAAASPAAASRNLPTAETVPERPMRGITFENLTVTYPGLEVPPVRDLTLTAEAGRVTAVLGRSGCGKTTLLKAAAGLLEPASGAVRFTGGDGARPHVSMVFQEATLLPWKTVRENVALALPEPGSGADAAELARREAKVNEVLALTGLTELAGRLPDALSGGQQQRAGLARALAADPEILLMDEPFGALDALTRLELQRESRALFARSRMTVLMITHDVAEAVRMADRAAVLRDGRAAAEFAIDLPHPRRTSDPAAGALEEAVLAELLRR